MKKLTPLTSVIGLALSMNSFAQTHQETTANLDPVELIVSQYQCSRAGCYFDALVKVKDLAFEKKLNVVYSDYSQQWLESPCHFEETIEGANEELWRCRMNKKPQSFAFKFDVNGETYWDNNDGKDYGAAEINRYIMGKNQSAKVVKSLAYPNAYLNIAADDSDGDALMTIVYSTDNWVTVQSVQASTYSKHGDGNADLYNANIPLQRGQTLKYAVRFQNGSATFWDNNFGRDYQVTGR